MILTNSQYEQLMSKYYERQLRTKHITQQREAEVRAAIPAFNELDRQIRHLSVDYARQRLTKTDHSTGGGVLQQQIQAVTREKEALLASHGFPTDYLQPVYTCADCKDTGYIGDKKCHCFERAIVDFLYSQSNLQDILDLENFDHFDLSLYPDDYIEETTGQTPRDNMRNILATAKKYVQGFQDEPSNLLLYGNTGVGKTFLTNCIARELLDQSHTVVYLTSLRLFDILETYKFDRYLSHEEKDASTAYILDSDLLIIDDLGTELNNSFTSSQLYHCIDVRLNHRKSTIISTNLSFDDLRERYSERIFSRLTSSYILLKLTGDDIRLRKAIAQ
jgi:DNA replication protein